MGPAGSDETSDVHYGRARGDTLAPPQPARHFSSPATDFPTWSCGVSVCVPQPAPATGQKAAARAAWRGLQGMLSPRWWRSKGSSPPGKTAPIRVCTHGTTFPSSSDVFGLNPLAASRVQNLRMGEKRNRREWRVSKKVIAIAASERDFFFFFEIKSCHEAAVPQDGRRWQSAPGTGTPPLLPHGQRRLERPEVARGGGWGDRPPAAASLQSVSKSRFITFFFFLIYI